MTHKVTCPDLSAQESEWKLTILAKPAESQYVLGCICNASSIEFPDVFLLIGSNSRAVGSRKNYFSVLFLENPLSVLLVDAARQIS